MRYPETEIKAAILHPEYAVREYAVRYFADGSSADDSIMPLVIQAVEQFGRNGEGASIIGGAAGLHQTEETISWVLKELNAEGPLHENYQLCLGRVLLEADPILLAPRRSEVLAARHLLSDYQKPLSDRIDMLAWDAETCWAKLDSWARENQEVPYLYEADLPYGRSAADALARASHGNAQAILNRLEKSHEQDPPLDILGPMIVRAAGECRLEAAIPKIISNLTDDLGDLMNQECATALTRIGTPPVLDAIAKAWPTAPNHFGLYCTGPLRSLRSDAAVRTALELLKTEKDHELRSGLIDAILGNFEMEGIGLARSHLLLDRESIIDNDVYSSLLMACKITGERFPEYDAWLAEEEAEKEEHRRKMQEIGDDPEGFLRYAVERFAAQSPKQVEEPDPFEAPAPPVRAPFVFDTPRTGRNEPCPCGSGKKFKNCCLKKSRG